jgi:NDP-sugar pyrophosphorylase family protein
MPEPELRALVLTAGLGTRLRPLTYLRAKAAVPINGEPLVGRAITALVRAGVRDLVLNLHHHPATIAAIVGDGDSYGARVRYSWEQPILGSAGGPRHALPLLIENEDADFLIVNGDTLTTVDPGALIARHRESGALVTMALIENPRPQQYGGVAVSTDGWVTGFGRTGRYHFIGVQAAKARAFASLQDGVAFESVNRLYPQLMAANSRTVAAHLSHASFLDIGTPRDCLETSLSLAEKEGPHLVGARAKIHPSARLVRTTLWDDVTVGANARLHECIVADRATIPEGATFGRCAIIPAGDRSPASGERVVGNLLVRDLEETPEHRS